MFIDLFQYQDLGLFLLRLVVAIIFIYHSLPKLKTPQNMATGMNWPKSAVFLLGLVELLSALALIIGIYVQLAALLLMIVMLGALTLKITKWHTPFSGKDTTGWEFDLLILTSSLLVLIFDGGLISLY